MIKACDEHGKFKSLVERDRSFYEACLNKSHAQLRVDRLDLSVAHRCNLDCSYCYFPRRDKEELSYGDIEKLVEAFKGDTVCLSGGEATLREDLPDLVRLIIKKNKIPVLETNGLKLVEEDYVRSLRQAGLKVVHFSLNGLDEDTYFGPDSKRIAEQKLKALENLLKHLYRIHISFLIERGRNEDQLKKIIEFSLENSTQVRQLRIRSVTLLGRYDNLDKHYTTSEILELLCNVLGEDKERLIKILEKKKRGKCLCKFSGNYYFHDNIQNYLGVDVTTRDGALSIIKLIGKYGKYVNLDYAKSNLFYKYKRLLSLKRALGVQGYRKARDSSPPKRIKSLNIEIRSWPHRFNVDLEEVTNCPSVGLSSDEKRMLPFCYRFFSDEEANLQKIREDVASLKGG